ncbi:flagellar hook-associated protein 2 [Peribacillus huizhouensis]|uniref:Flagellar hook-associated protein 2 n=1 Tax=Peribacillus huizhouensis TaxID=1501239 RepID=A0ABR6CNX5_9BACI|nr:flagellar hook-associated protein 2 [Peribacillus huizhouensis]MBA9026747.1 flagellar hook-associated protein 2 [Peribacillus huizhouensis]
MVRVSGLASGMDIDELVKSMMQAARVPMDKLTQKKTYSEWQRDDYRSMNTALLELDTLIREGIGMQKSFIKKTVRVSDPEAISVKNINSTSDFSGTLKVDNLATAATMFSKNKTSVDDQKKTLKDLGLMLDGESQTITILAINKDGGFDTEVQKDENGKDVMVNKPYTLTINSTDTLESVINKINADSGVTVFFDQQTQKFSMTAKNTGDVKTLAEIQLKGDLFTKTMQLDTTSYRAFQSGSGSVGTNASVIYNGLKIERSSNTFTINGAEITLKKETTDPVTFSSTADVDAILDTVTKFVTKYNEVIAKIKDKTGESKYRSFTPLTAEQKKAMTEDEVKLWEEKAKSGTLKNDSTLKSLLTTMRSSLYTSVSGLNGTDSLSKLGITTTSNYLDGGKLTIDEDKLRAAISEDPNAIYNLFMKEDSKKDGSETGEMGLARRLRANLKASMATITEQAGKAGSLNNNFTIGKSLNSLETRISAFEAKLTKLETRYYNQFTAMEKAIQRANSQSASLMQYFS